MSTAYRVAPIFLIRLAGAPFEAVEQLGTPLICQAARAMQARGAQFDLGRGRDRQVSAETDLFDQLLQREVAQARESLWRWARKILPDYLLFASTGTENLTQALQSEQDHRVPRHSRLRGREQHLLLYLQRICTKNDTFSEFGPTCWGSAQPGVGEVTFQPAPGVAARDAFLERWSAHAIAAAMNADAEVIPELCPRRNPIGRINGLDFLFTDSGEMITLTRAESEVIERCDGSTPGYAFNGGAETLRGLIERKVLRCQVEVPALEPHAVDRLCQDVEGWREGEVRSRWLSVLKPLTQLADELRDKADRPTRQRILESARSRLHAMGAAANTGGRSLYSAANVIGEECFRASEFRVSEKLIDEVATDAAPWIDLWRDSYAFVASRVAAGLQQVFHKTPSRNGAIALPAFLRACESANLPLCGSGLVALAVMAFQEVKNAFLEQLRPHADGEVYDLTVDDCHVVRNTFKYPKFDDYTYPSADLQVSARSAEAFARGDHEWVLAELHPPVALLHHCMYWSCPDKDLLNNAFARGVFGKPNFHYGFFAADFTAHTTVRIFDALRDLSYFVAPQRGNPAWRTVPPAEAEVYIDDQTGDVALRKAGSREHLGSFARAWLIPLGFHPFQFSLAPHTPRLRCGRVVVQRRTWTIAAEEIPEGNYTGVSRNLVLAIERLRAQKQLPRYIYIRPTERALRRTGAENRDKDTKPVFVDLESYLFMEIFHRWLVKAGELEITEMLPDPDHLLWREPDGRHTFELRTLIVPRS